MKPILQYRHLIFLLKFFKVTERKNVTESKKVRFLKCNFSVTKDMLLKTKVIFFLCYQLKNVKHRMEEKI